jgi:predicted AlkP superfamily phosphohydrolase/phosphomutase
LLKLYDVKEQDFSAYYKFHLNYFLENYPNEHEAFFDHILDIIKVRIDYFKKLKPFTRTYARNMANVRNLEAFVTFMKTVDRWHKLETIESVIAEKDRLIDELRIRITVLEAEVKEARIYETAEKVNITKGGIAAFMDVMKQIQNLTFEANSKLVNAQTQAPYYKMIAKYFKHGSHSRLAVVSLRCPLTVKRMYTGIGP